MKGSKHSRQPSDSATASRRRDAQTRAAVAQTQAYQQRLSSNSNAAATYYSMPSQGQDYETYHAGTVLPQQAQQYAQYTQPQVDQQDLRRSASTSGWSMQEEEQSYQQQPPPQQPKQKSRLLKHAEAKTLLDARHRPSSGAWSIRDDQQLIMARSDGLNWSQIQEQFFPSKSSNACRKRHERLIDSKGRGGGDEAARMERIATEYVQMRERLWRPLADKTGEKWAYVERACLSSGLKNLQGVARAANRRQRFDANAMAAAAAAPAYDDDSGMGLTPVEDISGSSASGGGVVYHSSSSPPATTPGVTCAAQSFASTATQATATQFLAHPQHLAQAAHLHPSAYASLVYGGAQYHPPHAYSSSISSEGSLHPGYVSRRGNESS